MTRPRPAALAVLLVVALAGACVPTGERPELTDDTIGGSAAAPATECLPVGDQFAEFTVQTITVDAPDGPVVRCVLVADRPDLRQRGLSGVPDLGGHSGMIFAFADDTTGSFWMGNTHVPLTIAFVDAGGTVVTVHDMEPCPDAGPDCASYFPDGPYRWALEVPRGGLAAFGLVEGARLDPTSLPTAAG